MNATLEEITKLAAEAIRKAETPIAAITHIDADGIASAAIAIKALLENGKRFFMTYGDSLSQRLIDTALSWSPSVLWLMDLGSSNKQLIEKVAEKGTTVVITDHHAVSPDQMPSRENVLFINSNVFGIDGGTHACGATMTYLVARHMVADPVSLVPFVVVGAIGDRQADRGLVGLNRELLQPAIERKVIERHAGLRIFGRSTLDLPYALAYSTSFDIPGIRGDIGAAINFLGAIGIRARNPDDTWRKFSQLTEEEVKTLQREIVLLMNKHGFSPEQITACFGEYYSFPQQPKNTYLYFADELATLLNACSRGAGRTDLAIGVLLGRKELYDEAVLAMDQHRATLREIFEYLREGNVGYLKNLAYAILPERFSYRIVGNVVSKLLNSDMSRGLPVVACGTNREEGVNKFSLRVLNTHNVKAVEVINKLCEIVPGASGGGHDLAGGFYAPIEVPPIDIITTLDKIIAQSREKAEG